MTVTERLSILEVEQVYTKMAVEDVKKGQTATDAKIDATNTKLDTVLHQLSGFKGGGIALSFFLTCAAAAVGVLAWLGFGRG